MKLIQVMVAVAMLATVVRGVGAEAKEPTLNVGDAAPKLQVAKWVQGEPVKGFEKGKAYIVEFWATWCGPCRVSIPHLNDLHNAFKDKGLIVIGQDVWEKNTDEVPKFVKKMGDKMTYRVALDDTEGEDKGKMAETWMVAAGQRGIPAAFVVNKQGKIAWIGHPMELKEKLLEQVLDGTHDLDKAAADYAQRRKNEEQLNKLGQKLNTSMRNKEWDQAEATLAEMEKLLPEESRGFLMMTRFRVLAGKKDYEEAFKVVRKLSDTLPDNPMLQNQIAWDIATMEGLEKRDLEVAELAAQRAVKASKGKDASILDTLARVQFLRGDKAKAVETQQKALELAEGQMKGKFQETLDSYKAGKLPDAD
jgi:thiol-disulfide isomerase/thioredoxin